MAHVLFIVLHAVAFCSGPPLLLFTVPLHIGITRALSHRRALPKRKTHALCPDCKGVVRRDACACMHCRCILVPTA